MTRARRVWVVVATAMVVVAGCSSDEGGSATEEPAGDTAAPATDAPTTEPPETAPPETAPPETDPAPPDGEFVLDVVETLSADELGGRENFSEGSRLAQDYLIGILQQFAEPFFDAEGEEGYRHPFAEGVNLLGVIPGSDLADEYVVVGAHYDHIGSECTGSGPDDSICNGATDNATGVAAALQIMHSIVTEGAAPRRTIVIALWDAEEDGLRGAEAFLADAYIPAESIVTYVNFDIQGTSMSPALTNATVMVGTETGGPVLQQAAVAAAEASTLDTYPLSLLFGQGRSDHAPFATAGVPVVFFTDATPPCYHTVGDDLSIVDFPKLDQQIATAEALTRTLMDTDTVPVFDGTAPPASYDDAVALLGLVSTAQPDFGRFTPETLAAAEQLIIDLTAIVDAGAEAFGEEAVGTVLSGALLMVGAWASGPCEAFIG